MLAKTAFSISTDLSAIKQHLGIPHDHPALIRARRDFQTSLRHSVVLIIRRTAMPEPLVVSLVDSKRAIFTGSFAHTYVICQLNKLAGRTLLDRELFLHALHRLYLSYHTYSSSRLTLAPQGQLQDACFQLLFDYSPDTYCIATTEDLVLQGDSTEIRYSKYDCPEPFDK